MKFKEYLQMVAFMIIPIFILAFILSAIIMCIQFLLGETFARVAMYVSALLVGYPMWIYMDWIFDWLYEKEHTKRKGR